MKTTGNLNVNTDVGLPTANVSWMEPTVTDNSGFFTLTTNHTSGSAFAIGVTTVTYTATDPSGNTAGYSFDITVQGI